MRLIDADKLKQHYAWWGDCEGSKERKEVFDTIVDLQPTVNEWISVKDRLPEKSGRYIVFGLGWNNEKKMSTLLFGTKTNEWIATGAWKDWKVTHWMPLPEPPEVEE